ncbi:MAG: hypothetical protein DIU69_08050 [Bacillota bacterium]|nr:MAG: hypothetical protein DIU69_08050 [Bacillota bacterium]
MRERLKPVARAVALLMFILIAYLWQKQTGAGAAYLLASTLAVVLGVLLFAGSLFGILYWISRAGSGSREAGSEEPARPTGTRLHRLPDQAAGGRPAGQRAGRSMAAGRGRRAGSQP